MPPWLLKAAVQGTLARLPDPQRWNRLFQRYVTRTLTLREPYFLSKWRTLERHVDHLSRHLGVAEPSFTALELGTGWFPITAIGLALSGARVVYSIDRQDLLARDRVLTTLGFVQDQADRGQVVLRGADARARLARALEPAPGRSAREILAAIGVRAIVADARDAGLPDGSVDLICSNNTLEHIPHDVLLDLFRAFRRLVTPDGLMSHHIDLGDHFAHFDRNITAYNFLRFSDRTWALLNNDLLWQNRLRVSDYRAIHAQTGWQVAHEDSTRQPLDVLRSVPLAERFRAYREEDLAVYATWMTATPA